VHWIDPFDEGALDLATDECSARGALAVITFRPS